MCGRFTNQASWQEYYSSLRGFLSPAHEAWKAPVENPEPRYNLAPTQLAPIIIRDGDGLEGVMARWDFVPWSTRAQDSPAASLNLQLTSWLQYTIGLGKALEPI
jgi:putative SOS response-associated peptidase YedK